MEYGNMLAEVGSPGSGKTTISIKTAQEIAKHHKNVIVVFADPFVPVLPFVLPMDEEQKISLGELLTLPTLTQNQILKSCVTIPDSEYISVIGYCMGESLLSYPKVTRERAIDFLVNLRHLADYVILDCTSILEADVFSILSMEMADKVLRMGTSNLRGISYYQSHWGMISGTSQEKYISAIGNYKTGQVWEAAAEQYGGVSFVFPYVAELERQYDEAVLFEKLGTKDAVAFQTEIKKLIAEVFGLHESVPVKAKSGGAGKKKLTVRSPFVWNKGEF